MQRRTFRQIKPLEAEAFELEIENLRNGGELRLHLPEGPSSSRVSLYSGGGQLEQRGYKQNFTYYLEGSRVYLSFSGKSYVFEEILPFGDRGDSQKGDGRILSKMPGRIIQLAVSPGDPIEEGKLVLVMESMKMENRVLAPIKGEVGEVLVAEGDLVEADQVLLSVVAHEG